MRVSPAKFDSAGQSSSHYILETILEEIPSEVTQGYQTEIKKAALKRLLGNY